MNLLLQGQHLGFLSDIALNGSARAITTTTWQAFSFIARGAVPDAFTFWQTTKTGSPAASDIQLCLCADNGGIPNSGTVIETQNAASIPATSGRLVFSGWTTSLTEGAQYWVFLKSVNAVAGVTITYVAGSMLGVGRYAASALHGWGVVATTNSGTAWATNAATRSSAMLVTYPSSVYEGVPIRGLVRTDAAGASNRAYGNRETGFECLMPVTGLTYNARGVWMPLQRVGTITSASAKIYNSSGTLLGTSRAVVGSQITTTAGGAGILFEFSSTVALTRAAGPHRFVVAVTGGDASNYVQAGWLQLFDTSSDVVGLAPMGGSWCRTITLDSTAGPIVWTDTLDELPPGSIVLDPATPFAVPGGGSTIYSFGGLMTGGMVA